MQRTDLATSERILIDKISSSVAEALAGTADGSTILVGGFGTAGIPIELIDGLIDQGARDLIVVNNMARCLCAP